MQFLIPVSYARSGSTVIQRVLNTSNDIFISGEKLGLAKSTYELVNSMKYMKYHLPEIFQTIETSDDRNPAFNAHKIDIDGLITDIRNIIVRRIISPPPDRVIVGWKENFISPVELGESKATEILQFIKYLLPDCRFIINIRDPEKTANSTVWKLKDGSMNEIDRWRSWLIGLHESSELGNNSTCLVNHDEWSIDKTSLIKNFVNFGLNINEDAALSVLDEHLIHLKDWQI